MAKSNAFSIPSNLSLSRSISPSVFAMYATRFEEKALHASLGTLTPVTLRNEKARGIQNSAKLKAEKRCDVNIMQMDIASLPVGKPDLTIAGSVLVTSDVLRLVNVNSKEFSDGYAKFIEAFIKVDGFYPLAERYVMNLVNGRILFRNRIGSAIQASIHGFDAGNIFVTEDDFTKPLSLSAKDIKRQAARDAVTFMARRWADIFSGKSPSKAFDVRVTVTMGEMQEVYPSQEFLDDDRKGEGKVLARAMRTDGVQQAAIHARKIGNGIRTIDDWYPGATRPVAVEPFAPELSTQTVHREKGNDFYSLLTKLPEMTKELEAGKLTDEALFTVAMCIRGGVFGVSSAEKVES